MQTLVFYLRIGLTGAWFFVGCLLSSALLLVRWKDPSVGATLGRIVHWGGIRALGLRVRVENASRLYTSQPCVYILNHQSNIDIITMGCMYPYRTVVIGKNGLKWIPLFGLFFVGSGMIMIDRKNHANAVAGLDQAKEAMLKTGKSIWLFAEGTRNRGRTALLPFKKGAFHIAISAQVPIVVTVHQHLYSYVEIDKRRVYPGQELVMKVLEPIPTKGMTLDDMPKLMALVRERMLETMRLPEMKFPQWAIDNAVAGKSKKDLALAAAASEPRTSA